MKILAAFTRLHVAPERFDETVAFHARLFDATPGPRFTVSGLEATVCRVGQVLVITAPAPTLERLRASALTLVVESLADAERWLEENGARILQPRRATPTGFHLHAQHPGGVDVEYVELAARE